MSLNFKKGIIDYIHKDSKSGTIIYPRTLASAVYDKNGEPISNKLNTGMYKESDVKDNIVTFNSDDMVDKSYVEEKDPVSGENIPVLDEYYLNDDNKKWHIMHPLYIKDKLSVCFEKITTLFHNVRYLYEMLGTTDISSIDNGTVTGALSHLNTEASTLKKSVADGKESIANALSAQGQNTAVDAAFATLASNVTIMGNARYNNGHSVGYNSGYAQGVTAADNRTNTNSANYKSGYNAGTTDGRNIADNETWSAIFHEEWYISKPGGGETVKYWPKFDICFNVYVFQESSLNIDINSAKDSLELRLNSSASNTYNIDLHYSQGDIPGIITVHNARNAPSWVYKYRKLDGAYMLIVLLVWTGTNVTTDGGVNVCAWHL